VVHCFDPGQVLSDAKKNRPFHGKCWVRWKHSSRYTIVGLVCCATTMSKQMQRNATQSKKNNKTQHRRDESLEKHRSAAILVKWGLHM
jgi:hypothetical protein